MRSCKKLKEATHSGAGSVKFRKYIYSDQLCFLHKLTIERSTEDSLSSVIEERERDEPETASASSSGRRSDQASYKRKKHDEVEHVMIKALQAGNNPGSNMSLFAGIVPYLRSFNADDLPDFQMGVLQLISKIKCNKKRHAQVMSHGLHDKSFSQESGGTTYAFLQSSLRIRTQNMQTPKPALISAFNFCNKNLNYGYNLLFVCIIFCLELNVFFLHIVSFLMPLIDLFIDKTLIKFLNELHLIVIANISIGGTRFLILVFSR
jgi:hypothetical protein